MTDTPKNECQPIIDHTLAVREWMAAPFHERGYYWTRVETAWRQVRSAGFASQASTAATGLMRYNGKLKGIK